MTWSKPGEQDGGKKQTVVEFVVGIEEEEEHRVGSYDRFDPQQSVSLHPALASVVRETSAEEVRGQCSVNKT
jgi:hypothetical protein